MIFLEFVLKLSRTGIVFVDEDEFNLSHWDLVFGAFIMEDYAVALDLAHVNIEFASIDTDDICEAELRGKEDE